MGLSRFITVVTRSSVGTLGVGVPGFGLDECDGEGPGDPGLVGLGLPPGNVGVGSGPPGKAGLGPATTGGGVVLSGASTLSSSALTAVTLASTRAATTPHEP
ncbi:MAG: hypothetical protein M3P04_01135, partial [Actinomycetota bacterium]|nr:hypothetical protein [Actinomycetota bacterium]